MGLIRATACGRWLSTYRVRPRECLGPPIMDKLEIITGVTPRILRSMTTLLVFEFPSTGPFGVDAEAAYKDLATDIAGENGLIWKVWTEDPQRQVAGGVYLFADEASAQAYVEKHTARLADFGISNITATAYEVNKGLSRIDHAVLER